MPLPLHQSVRFYIRTLGCKMNWLDSARLGAALRRAGHTAVADEAEADFVLVNSCTVTAEADRKSRQQAYAAQRAQKRVAVLGCGPRVDPAGWTSRLTEDLVFDKEEDLLAFFGAAARAHPVSVKSRTRLPIAIQTGCDDTCSFCITRIARGPHRSLPAEDILRQVRRTEDLGLKEVVLTGINLAAWGCAHTKRPEQSRLADLITTLLERTTIPRIRLSSLGPQYLSGAFFDVLADPRLCEHLHLSVQSGSPAVLRRMERGHDVEVVYRLAEAARALRPDVALTADLIVGFPGETDSEFEQTLGAVSAVGFAKLHVFPYSARNGTTAARLPDAVAPALKKERAARLRALGAALRRRFIAGQLGKTHTVLVEGNSSGLTGNYVRVRTPGSVEGTLQPVELTETNVADA